VAYIKGKTAVIWNSQTATIIEEDLTRIAAPKEMGFGSVITAIKTWPKSTAAIRCVFTSEYGKMHRKASGIRNTQNGLSCVRNLWRNTVFVNLLKTQPTGRIKRQPVGFAISIFPLCPA